MSTTELVTSKNTALEELNKKLALLKGRAEALRVVDQPTYIEAAQLKLEIQAYQKAVKFQTRPEIEILTEQLRKAQAEEKMLLFPADQMLATTESKRKTWMEEERRKAEEEQRRINEERRIEAARKAEEERKERERQAEVDRKAREKEIEAARKAGEIKAREAERLKKEAAAAQERERIRAAEDAKTAAVNVQEIRVKPSIPTVAGVKNQVYWKFRIIDPKLIPPRFQMPNEVDIGRMVRDTKDKAKAEAECPGIEVYSE